ncbi:MAG TPA: hypothetical protein VFF28_01345 [Candidatus Nanoarchaeia archaeon]|nr:hypothetical protein [Candidatus Nanoarchaeia archaeon]
MSTINEVLSISASVALLLAVYFSYKLSRETKHERYWLLLSLGLFIFAVHHWFMIIFQLGNIPFFILELLEYLTSIVAGILIAYSTYGLYKSMRAVNQRVR